jgi:hypothetical protein
MRSGGRLEIDAPISPRLLRRQWEFQGVQRAWSRLWEFETGEPQAVEVPLRTTRSGRRGSTL